jgi:hypothetical protein
VVCSLIFFKNLIEKDDMICDNVVLRKLKLINHRNISIYRIRFRHFGSSTPVRQPCLVVHTRVDRQPALPPSPALITSRHAVQIPAPNSFRTCDGHQHQYLLFTWNTSVPAHCSTKCLCGATTSRGALLTGFSIQPSCFLGNLRDAG